MNEEQMDLLYRLWLAYSEAHGGKQKTGDIVHIKVWRDGPGEGEGASGGREADRESSLYFDRLWLSEIGIKG